VLAGFHPQMVFLPNLGVNLRACLCGAVNYASAQGLDFPDLGEKWALGKNPHCWIGNTKGRPSLATVFYGWALAGFV
jgi:hypothetical protein